MRWFYIDFWSDYIIVYKYIMPINSRGSDDIYKQVKLPSV